MRKNKISVISCLLRFGAARIHHSHDMAGVGHADFVGLAGVGAQRYIHSFLQQIVHGVYLVGSHDD